MAIISSPRRSAELLLLALLRSSVPAARRPLLNFSPAHGRAFFLGRKMFQIIQIPGPRSCAFIPAQETDADVMQSQEARGGLQSYRDPRIPSPCKRDTTDLIVEVDSIRWPAELDDYARLKQLLGRVHTRNIIVPKNLQALKKAARIGRRALVKQIDISSQPRIAVKDNGLASHHEATHPKALQQADELNHVRRKRGFFYFRRWHSRTSGLGGG